ncbi:hypothetical protein [Clostridium sp.]|uniref:hypothetical protein n=1 Tax=Clostridium sp. TaxID=1506 RepID=UPI003D6D9D8C
MMFALGGEFVNTLTNSSKGINLQDGWAPCSCYWLVDDSGEVIGVIRIRHRVGACSRANFKNSAI